VAVAAPLLFWNLGASSFHNGDEARYAQSAREMVESGDYVTITFRGEPFFHKPPGKIWLMALGYHLFGINEFGARFSSALFALLSVVLTFLLGRALYGRAAGFLGGLILLSSTQFIHEHCGRTAECEPEIIFLWLFGVLCLWYAGRDQRWLLGLAASAGLLVMVKGPVAVPLFIISFLYLMLTGKLKSVRMQTVVLGALTFLVITLPWHVYQLALNGEAFKRVYWDAHIMGRITGAPPESEVIEVTGLGMGGKLFYYPKIVFYSMFPWSILVVPALLGFARDIVRRRGRADLLLILWVVVYLLTITLLRGKLHWYVVPVIPALALCAAEFCRRLVAGRSRSLVVGLAIAAILAAVFFVPAVNYDPYSRHSVRWITFDQNVIPLWATERLTLVSIVPIFILLSLAATAAGYCIFNRRQEHCDWRLAISVVLLGLYAFTGLYCAALPLGGAGSRSELAQCHDAALVAGIEPEQVLLLGSQIAEQGLKKRHYFYSYGLSGGMGKIIPRRSFSRAVSDSTLFVGRSLVLADANLADRLPEHGIRSCLWKGSEMEAYYVED
jgi:4-amino-4-deoxy-L-arabinose transferase-like glycosyltransferase